MLVKDENQRCVDLIPISVERMVDDNNDVGFDSMVYILSLLILLGV